MFFSGFGVVNLQVSKNLEIYKGLTIKVNEIVLKGSYFELVV